MRIPLTWLAEFVDLELAPEVLAERLTLLGMEVQRIERWGSDWENVVVGELLSVDRHPNADRLSLTTVTVGEGEPLSIVCGATNIAPGQRIPVALPGAVLPGGRRIERAEKMGVVSNGMLCSGDELGLSSDADGILILEPGTPLGRPLVELYGDTVLDIDVKPNRGDALSIVGLAREVAAITGSPLRFPPTEPPEGDVDVATRLAVEVAAPDRCPRFVGRWVEDVAIGPSPDRIQRWLTAAGQRPVNNVVDASNVVMLELGKPIHTFDGGAVALDADGRAALKVRLAAAGERLTTLDHVERELDPETLLIADGSGPLAIAGIMGGASSEIGDTTTTIAVESAIFDPVSIRRTAFRHALRSEASIRFEKGQEVRLARLGADRTARLVAEWAGGRVARGRIDSAPIEPDPRRVAFRPARVNRLLGTGWAADEQRALLTRVGIETEAAPPDARVTVAGEPKPLAIPSGEAETWTAFVPSWRRDLAIEADVAEEVARIGGYDRIPTTLPDTTMPAWRPDPLEARRAVREALVGAGLAETVTHALVSPEHLATTAWGAPESEPALGESSVGDGPPVTVVNPISRENSVLRRNLLGSLLDVVGTNVRHGTADVAIFEVGKGYAARTGELRAGELRTTEWWRLGIALSGVREPAAWNRPARPADLDDLKGLVELLAVRLGAGAPVYEPLVDEPRLHSGRAARAVARLDGGVALAGRIGEVHPGLLAELDVRADRILVAELSVVGLAGGDGHLGGRLPAVRTEPPPRVPDAERDIAVVVPESRAAGEVEAALRRAVGEPVVGVRLFDVYRGQPLEAETKSLAFRLTFRAPDRAVDEAEMDAAVAAASAAVGELGGRIRT
jgi:phenylalanyl-tRNA synthetase beta chain